MPLRLCNGTNIACRNHPGCTAVCVFFFLVVVVLFVFLASIFYSIPDSAHHKLPSSHTCTQIYMQKYTLRHINPPTPPPPPQQSWDCFKMSEDASVAKFQPLIVKLRMCVWGETSHWVHTHIYIQAHILYMYIGSYSRIRASCELRPALHQP